MSLRRSLAVTFTGAALAAAAVAGCSGSGGTQTPPAGPTTAGSSPSTGPSAPGSSAGGQTPAPVESNPAGDIPDNQAYVAYSPAGAGFTVKVPEGWARTETGGVTVFTDKLNRVEMSRSATPTAPTVQAATTSVVPELSRQVPAFTMGKASQTSRQGGAAVLLTYQGNSAPDPVTGKIVRDAFERYAFHRGGTEVVITVSGPVNADNVDPWRIVTDSFRWQ
ncbi:hypothetical protein QMK19_27845 [Streptomyces sp. H10-C2]|uniref:hypothetical protein n=1 Tax=unclassified Streptomyces TaxID=2593676 RepID=UPI0024B88987|nr:MULTISPECIES: hypothetical protein [unclassified Streptomyces]MDJ0343923.1 hypothetical protein [Streptomyces sp. PH10-H1]MDJ0373364.1 hypothetical protein [Streptomyces sp. H10-C2]